MIGDHLVAQMIGRPEPDDRWKATKMQEMIARAPRGDHLKGA